MKLMRQITMNKKLIILLFTFLFSMSVSAKEVSEIRIEGNQRLEKQAVLNSLLTKLGSQYESSKVAKDIMALYELGLFSQIEVYRTAGTSGTIVLTYKVSEKPSIVDIKIVGASEIKKEDLEEKLSISNFSTVDEKEISQNIDNLKKEYQSKGYYLAQVSSRLEDQEKGKVHLVFDIIEGEKVKIGSVSLVGNNFISDGEIMDKFASQPVSRISSISSGSVFNQDLLARDKELIGFLYREEGFAQVKVSDPIMVLDKDKKYARIVYEIEEGSRYKIGSVEFAGDLIFDDLKAGKDLIEIEGKRNFLLKTADYFKYTNISKSVEYLVDRYGDDGYAFANISPLTNFNEKDKTIDFTFQFERGEKVYVGRIDIVGNTKTRDNVIRREVLLSEGDLFSGTKLRNSKKEIERLGYFESVQVIRNRDEKVNGLVNLVIRVKNKPTGQLQASIGFNPSDNTSQSRIFGQGKFEEKNLGGKAWAALFNARWNTGDNYQLNLEFSDPRINDSIWSGGASLFFNSQVTPLFQSGLDVQQKRVGVSLTLGRKVIERIRASLTYRLENITLASDQFLLDRFVEEGTSSSLTLGVSRNVTNNFLDPSEGSRVTLAQKITGGPVLRGDHEYMETTLSGAYYYPIDFTDTYRTYFKLSAKFGYIYNYRKERVVPFFERYRLGGPNDLRGYSFQELGPKVGIFTSPGYPATSYNQGGNKNMVFQLEYFFPLIPQAGLKGILFGDAGRVFDNAEDWSFKDLNYDIGFGFRWITPVAPFRFEWAYPIENGKIGEGQPILSLGF